MRRWSTEDNEDGLMRFDCSPPLVHVLRQSFKLIGSKHDNSGEDVARMCVKLEDKLGHDAEVGTTSTDSIEQVWVLGFTGFEDPSIRNNHGGLHEEMSVHSNDEMRMGANYWRGTNRFEIVNGETIHASQESISPAHCEPMRKCRRAQLLHQNVFSYPPTPVWNTEPQFSQDACAVIDGIDLHD